MCEGLEDKVCQTQFTTSLLLCCVKRILFEKEKNSSCRGIISLRYQMAPKAKKSLKKKDSDSFGEKDPFKLKKEKKDAEKKKKEKGYKTFEAAESFSEEDDERGKGKKRGSLFRNRFAPSAKTKPKDKVKGDEKDGKTEERRPSKDKAKEDKKMKSSGEEKKMKASAEEKKVKGSSEEKKRSKSKEREKLKKKAHTIDVPYVKPEPIFGILLEDAVAKSKLYDNIELPKIVRECIDYVEEFGLTTAGIYRLSGVKSKVEALKAQYNNNNEKVNLQDCDPTIITSLFKLYLRELPETILTSRLTPVFEHAAGLTTLEERLDAFKKLLGQLPKCNYTLLSWTVVHLAHVLEKKEETKMTIQNLSIVMCPTMRISHRTMNILFTYWKEFFSDVKLKRCPKPLEWIPGTTFEIPETTTELEEELLRHELILAKMHEELNRGVAHKSTEDNLWEVQRVVTQLKRKLRVSRRVSETRLAAKEKEMEHKDTKTSSTSSSKERSPVKTMSPTPAALKEDVKETPTEVEKPADAPAPEDKAEEPVSGDDEVDVFQEKTEEDEEQVKEETKEEMKEEAKEESKEESRAESEEEVEKEDEPEKEAEPDLEMMKLLLLSQAEVVAEHDELMNIRNELQKRIEAERQEIAKLQSVISEAKQSARRRGASVDSLDSSVASESSSESEDEEELQRILEGLIRENEELRRKNMQLSHNIHNEREACAELRVQIKLQEQMPQMLEALAKAGIKDTSSRQRSGPKDPSGKPKKVVAIVAEPIIESSAEKDIPTNKSREDKNENINSNNSPEVLEEKNVDDAGKASSGVVVEKETTQDRHPEETAL
ncbi:ralA-binding protein 1 isoform X2 [Strongylocentrotus purpuratus]|uniref:Rho-GAP domain-containing protein n=1 Tax=Strongylocentrotus purpuratus TaxID=7668 RepID=A0A7M7HG60_STRPU|nr:ralA-binding protein 1 isoform X2 [Strongylocentrotus purpuratus]|eukprot:XP_011664018.1 PREDICTED: ralA-binding protein 1 isoform X2 [Strongylocentrotus purpuratus]